MTPTYRFRRFTPEDARTTLAWRYPPPLDLYDADPAYLKEDMASVLTPEFHYHAALDVQGRVVGFCCFGEDAQVTGGDYGRVATDVGLSLDPDLIGQGRGSRFLAAVLELGRDLFAPPRFRATVVDFNHRSRRLFERADFVQTQRFTPPGREHLAFVVLERNERVRG